MARIHVLSSKSTWTAKDVDFLIEMIEQPLPDPNHPDYHSRNLTMERRQELGEPGNEHALAGSMASTAISRGKRMDQSDRSRLEAVFKSHLQSDDSRKRLAAVANCKEAGLFADASVRARIEQLMSDPDRNVAIAAAKHLQRYDALDSALR